MNRRIPTTWTLAFTLSLGLSGAAVGQEAQAEADQPTFRQLMADAHEAHAAEDWSKCAEIFEQAAGAAESDRQEALAWYDVACCRAQAGKSSEAFEALGHAVKAGWRDDGALATDGDLASLRDDDRWPSVMEGAVANREAYEKVNNAELLRMFAEDQADRRPASGTIDWSVVGPRDTERRRRTLELLEAGEVKTADDHHHAALILQHGHEAEDYKLAHELSKKALELDPSHPRAGWLSAAAWDRYLHNTGKPQIYGTQFRKGEDGLWTLEPIDADAVTDEERAALGVPPLAEAYERAKAMNPGHD